MSMFDVFGPSTGGSRMSRMPDGTCAVTLEGQTLEDLGREAASWLWANPSKTVVAFSHAPETRLEPRAGMAGPREVTVQRGLLIVAAGEG